MGLDDTGESWVTAGGAALIDLVDAGTLELLFCPFARATSPS